MNRELVIPNLHVILIHYPLGVFFAGLLIELGGFMWRRSSVRTAARWMILIGALSMIPTAFSGIYALHDAALIGNDAASETWSDIASNSPLSADQWKQLIWHTWLMSGATALVVTATIAYLAMSDRLRNKLYLLTLAALLIGAGAMVVGAWFSGEAVYRYAVAVQDEQETPATQEAGEHQTAATTHAAKDADEDDDQVAPATQPTGAMGVVARINTMLPPVQPHVIMAGTTIAVALAAMGVSVRRITGDVPPPDLQDGDALVQSLRPVEPLPVIYPAKFWMVAMVLAIGTALGGWYVFGSDAGTFDPKTMWRMVAESDPDRSLNRGLAHVIGAGSLIFLPLILAGVAKWAPRRKGVLGVLSAILLLAIAAQVWFGLLLLMDGTAGALMRFN